MKFFYDIAIAAFGLSIKLASVFGNSKAKKWVEGRKNIPTELKLKLSQNDLDIIWVHASSLGEYEMGKPLIEEVKKSGKFRIVLSFFSPSGFENVDEEKEGLIKCYLPLDKKDNMKSFIDSVNPTKAIFVKNDIWINGLFELEKRNIKTYLISSSFRKGQVYFKSYASFFKKALKSFELIFVQDEASKKLLESEGIEQVVFSGDMRMDRTLAIASKAMDIKEMKHLSKDQPTLILGSSWPNEEEMLQSFVKGYTDSFNLVIAPHDVSEKHIEDIQRAFPKAVKLTTIQAGYNDVIDQLIIDKIGILKHLYAYADVALIGGAWSKGLHNILEAAAFGIPVLFGPNIKKFNEAKDLVDRGGAISVKNGDELSQQLDQLLNNAELRKEMGEQALIYVKNNKGACEKTFTRIFPSL